MATSGRFAHLSNTLFRLKPPVDLMVPHDDGTGLKRTLTSWQLASIGISCTVGTGIFVTFSAVVPMAGPAVLISFLLAGITAGLTALCYAELSSMIPAAGSSYSYTYASLGEIAAYLVGWCMILEYAVATAAVASGWSQYLNSFLTNATGLTLPEWASHASAPGHGFGMNLPALLLVVLCALLLIKGTSESAKTNAIMTGIKLTVLAFFVVIAAFGFHASNLAPFAPHGISGVAGASGVVFFSFIGLDAISTAGEEVENPQKALPKALILALVIVTGTYILVAVTAVGAQPAGAFEGQEAPLAQILSSVTGGSWAALVLAAAAVISIFSITLVTLYGQTRVLHAMSRDGLIPKVFSEIHPKKQTLVKGTVLVAIFVGALTTFIPLDILSDCVSLGTLTAFAVISAAVIILRRRNPNVPRGFRVPLYPVLPILSVLACLYLMYNLSLLTWGLFGIWIAIAAIVYFTYARHHAVLATKDVLPPHADGRGTTPTPASGGTIKQ